MIGDLKCVFGRREDSIYSVGKNGSQADCDDGSDDDGDGSDSLSSLMESTSLSMRFTFVVYKTVQICQRVRISIFFCNEAQAF